MSDDVKASSYKLEFSLSGLPKRTNNNHSTWKARMAEARKWKGAVYVAVGAPLRPLKPLQLCRLTLIRHSSVEPDFDGLCSSFKHVIDGLIHAQVIANDKTSNFVDGRPEYIWKKAPRNKGFITVKVEEP